MGTKNLSLLKTHFDSVRACFANNIFPGNMPWALTSLSVFIGNSVVYLFGLILQFIFRIQKADGKNELFAQPEDSQIEGFREELINFLFQSNEYVHDFAEDGIKESEDEKTENSVSEKTESDSFEDSESREEEEEGEEEEKEEYFSASMSEAGEEEFEASTKINPEFYDGGVKNEKEAAESPFTMEGISEVHENGMRRVEEETESSGAMEDDSVYENSKRREEHKEETAMSALMEDEEIETTEEEKEETGMSALMEDEEIEGKEEDEETEMPALISNKFEYVSGGDIIGFVEEPTTTMTFSFREFFVSPYVSDTEISEKEKSTEAQSFQEFHPSSNDAQVEIPELESEHKPFFQEAAAQKEISELKSEDEKSIGSQSFREFHPSPNGSEVEISELKSEHEPVFQEESQKEADQEQSSPSFHPSSSVSEEENEGSIQEQRMFHGHSSSDQFSLKSEIFRGRDSSDDDEDDLDFIDNSVESDSESESSSSSGLIWANSDKTDDLITYEFLSYQKCLEGLEPETLKLMQKLRAIDEFIELAPGKAENEDEKKGSKEEEEDDLEWDDDELVEQMKMEMRNARQGGLPTILEDEEEEEGQEVNESPRMAEDLRPLKIEDQKLEFKDHIREIQKVHKSYEEKMRKLDILNYQTMHALGLRQLKEPSEKPMILKNLLLWSRKDQKKSSEVVVSLVEELEVVYVGQLCLSWEILCWEYKKAIELKQYDGEWVRRYNVVAGEFQLFQVLLQRLIESEPFQGPRIHNYVRNRCVIRNLLQVPTIKDDSMKEMTKDEEEGISSERLAEIIRESMYIFCKFARADKHDINNNTFFKLPHQTKPTHLKDPSTCHLLADIQTHLHKKEKRLKDILRTGNCIVRKFQKQSEDKVQLDLEQMVAQVQLKLISRILSMSKLRTDQLIWCNDKLNRITFVDTKVHVEPSFFLFPF